jgi:hypothetical protein
MGERHAEPEQDEPRTPGCVRKAGFFLTMNLSKISYQVGSLLKNIFLCYDAYIPLVSLFLS